MSAPTPTQVRVTGQLSGRARTPEQTAFRHRFVDLFEEEEAFLPSAASALGRLMVLIQSPDSSLEECADVIALDPGLTARVFRVANSAAYAGKTGTKVSTLREAVIRLGLARLRQFVFSAQVMSRFSKVPLPAGWEHFWIRNVFSAQFIERAASHYFPKSGQGTEYLSGMLHDTGWLLFATYFPDEFKAVMESPEPLEKAEREIFSFSHADASAFICLKSNLPGRVVRAVGSHHQPLYLPFPKLEEKPEESDTLLSVLLFLCDRLADDVALPIGGRPTGVPSEAVLSGPEFKWLDRFGKVPDFRAIALEEIERAQSVCSAFMGA